MSRFWIDDICGFGYWVNVDDRENEVPVSEIKMFNYFKHEGKILQLIDTDFLDQWAVGYDHKTGETINMNIYTDVEPVNVEIVEVKDC